MINSYCHICSCMKRAETVDELKFGEVEDLPQTQINIQDSVLVQQLESSKINDDRYNNFSIGHSGVLTGGGINNSEIQDDPELRE